VGRERPDRSGFAPSEWMDPAASTRVHSAVPLMPKKAKIVRLAKTFGDGWRQEIVVGDAITPEVGGAKA
jgi:hypothetical protein